MAQIGAYFTLICLICSSYSQGNEVLVTTSYGSVLGTVHRFRDAQRPVRSVRKFLGVPYAAPPVAELRFQPPRTPLPWKPRVYNATYYRSVCYQDPTYNEYFWPNFSQPQSDDCLYLNIYSPANTSSLFPVMVYIHGGGYEAGSPVVSPGDVIPLWGVVLVSIQYRLGPLGFITTGDSIAPGNYGMLDQVQALKWVQENIENFGGDRSRVTIFGESAGGSSVGLHLLSPLSEGLFHRAIAMSGVSKSPFAIGSKSEVAAQSRKTAKQLGCETRSSTQMIKCLRHKSARDIPVQDMNVWRPIVDGHFLPDAPEELAKAASSRYVPLMAGFTAQDGAFFFPDVYEDLSSENYRKVTRAVFQQVGNPFGQQMTKPIPDDLLDVMVLLYKPWANTQDAFRLKRGLAASVTDYCFAAPVHAELTVHSQTGAPAYLYEFNHRSELVPSPTWRGVAHKDDTPYEFGFPLINLTVLQEYDDADRNVSRLVITLFTNFAKYGNPTPEPVLGVTWDRFNASHMTYLRIQQQPEMALNYRPTKMEFWNHYYRRKLNSNEDCVPDTMAKGRGSHVPAASGLTALVVGALSILHTVQRFHFLL